MSDLRIFASRFPGRCPLCAERWSVGTPLAYFRTGSEYDGRVGHPACVTADELGLPSVEEARERIAAIRSTLGGQERAQTIDQEVRAHRRIHGGQQ